MRLDAIFYTGNLSPKLSGVEKFYQTFVKILEILLGGVEVTQL